MPRPAAHPWAFKPRFRRHAFGWRSPPAVARVREAVSEITSVARHDRMLAAEGAVLFLERVSPALEHVDSSSGAIGAAVNHAIEVLSEIVASAPADATTRERWLERLWDACRNDQIPYIERLGDCWGELCASKTVASAWADRLIGLCRLAWSRDPKLRGFFQGATNCLSALLAAGRGADILGLLALEPPRLWHYRQYGVKALAAMGRTDDAIQFAEDDRGLNDSPVAVARVCEDILLAAGRPDDAYRRYALVANRAPTHTAWFRAVAKKYPDRPAAEILDDLARHTPGDEGKWFAAAKDAKLFDKAIALANLTPCSPQTLTRAARDFADRHPTFALEAGVTAIRWLVQGYGYDVTSLDVTNAYTFTMNAAVHAGRADEIRRVIRDLVAAEPRGERFVTKILGRDLRLV